MPKKVGRYTGRWGGTLSNLGKVVGYFILPLEVVGGLSSPQETHAPDLGARVGPILRKYFSRKYPYFTPIFQKIPLFPGQLGGAVGGADQVAEIRWRS